MLDNRLRSLPTLLAVVCGLFSTLFPPCGSSLAADDVKLPAGAMARLGDANYRLGGWKKHLAFVDDETLLCSSEQGAKVWNALSGEEVRDLTPQHYGPQGMQLSADCRLVFISGFYLNREERRMVYVIQSAEIATGRVVHRFEVPHSTFAVTPDGAQLLTADRDRINVYDLKTRELVEELTQVGAVVAVMAVSPDGRQLALATESNEVFLWNWRDDGSAPVEISRSIRAVGLVFSPDGRWLAIGPDSGTEVQLFDVAEKRVRNLTDADAPLYLEKLVFSPDSRTLYAANGIHLAATEQQVGGVPSWDVQSGQRIARLRMPHHSPRTMALSPNGKLLAASDWNSGLYIWNLATGDVVTAGPAGHTSQINAVAFIPGTDQIATISADETERVWQATTGQELRKTERNSGVWALAVSHDGSLAATSGHDNEIRLWQTRDGHVLHHFTGFERLGGRQCLAFTRDDKQLVALGSNGPSVRIFDVASGTKTDDLQIAPDALTQRNNRDPERQMSSWRFRLSRDATTLDVVTARTHYRYQIAKTEPQARAVQHLRLSELKFPVFDLDLSPDENFLVTAEMIGPPEEIPLINGGIRHTNERNHALVLRAAQTGEEIWRVPVAEGGYGPVRFSSNGKLIAAVINAESRQILILDAQTGAMRRKIEGVRPQGGTSLAFSSDDRWLASVQQGDTVLIWELENLPQD